MGKPGEEKEVRGEHNVGNSSPTALEQPTKIPAQAKLGRGTLEMVDMG